MPVTDTEAPHERAPDEPAAQERAPDERAEHEPDLNATPLPHGETGVRIAAALRDEILGGDYQPGERIRQQELAGRHGASRVPVREALRILEADGLVTIVANSGSWVSRLSVQECTEMYQMRERIEPLLLSYSAASLSAQVIEQLQGLADAMQRSADVEQFIALDRKFHLLSYSAASTLTLGDTIMRLWNRTQHYRRAYARMFRAERDDSVHHDHQLLVAALRNRDAEDAERVLAGHIRRTRLALSRHPEIFDA
jgi:DNA-binding GntR family transcriptional regulator